MKMYVVSRPLAEKLKAAGYPQNTQWYWELDGDTCELLLADECSFYEDQYFAAPMTDEIFSELLEIGSVALRFVSPENPMATDLKEWYGKTIASLPFMKQKDYFIDGKPADALAELWLWAKQEGYVK